MSEQPALRLVDTGTGELLVDDRDAELERLRDENEGLKTDVASARGTITKLHRELREFRAAEPESQKIRQVLEMCNEVWGRSFHVKVRGVHYEKIRERFKDRFEDRPPWTMDEFRLAAEGALLDSHIVNNGYLRPITVFRDEAQMQRFIKLATNFRDQAGVRAGDLTQVAAELRWTDWPFLLQVCECGHRRVEHLRDETCTRCECFGYAFDPLDEWNLRHDERLRRVIYGEAA